MPESRHEHSGIMDRCIGRRVMICAALLLPVITACGPSEPPAPAPLEIPVAGVIQKDVPIYIEMVGQTLGSKDIPIRARVEGFLESMDFREGRAVKAGDQLYSIDPRPFEAQVVEAQGYLAEAVTMLAKAKSDLARIRPLAEMKAVSQQDLDSAVAQYEAAKGAVQATEASLDQAEILLSYTRIESPIDGRIGISAAKVGEFVGKEPNPVVLNYVSQTDPIRVRFSINEREYLKFARQFADLREKTEQEEPDSREGLALILADGTVHDHPGDIVAYDAAIDPMTGTFMLEADFPNPRDIVLAGQFARVRGILETRKDALLVPQRAVSELQGNYRVFVVSDDDTVALREVKPGPKIDSLWVIESGLKPGERVAVEGILRLQPDMKVIPKAVDAEKPPETPADKAADGS